MKTVKGMILPMTLVMLALVTLLILAQLQMVFLYYKTMNQELEKKEAAYQLEAAATKILSSIHLVQNQRCITQEQDPNRIVDELKQQQGCIFDYEKQNYRYLIEQLAITPCLQTLIAGKRYSTQHWRLTVMSSGKNEALLQLRVAYPVERQACDLAEPIEIKAGLTSWRLIRA